MSHMAVDKPTAIWLTWTFTGAPKNSVLRLNRITIRYFYHNSRTNVLWFFTA